MVLPGLPNKKNNNPTYWKVGLAPGLCHIQPRTRVRVVKSVNYWAIISMDCILNEIQKAE